MTVTITQITHQVVIREYRDVKQVYQVWSKQHHTMCLHIIQVTPEREVDTPLYLMRGWAVTIRKD
jgi:hypothetical protein